MDINQRNELIAREWDHWNRLINLKIKNYPMEVREDLRQEIWEYILYSVGSSKNWDDRYIHQTILHGIANFFRAKRNRHNKMLIEDEIFDEHDSRYPDPPLIQEDNEITSLVREEIEKKLEKKYLEYYDLRLSGYNKSQCAKHFGVANSAITKWDKLVRNFVNKFLIL